MVRWPLARDLDALARGTDQRAEEDRAEGRVQHLRGFFARVTVFNGLLVLFTVFNWLAGEWATSGPRLATRSYLDEVKNCPRHSL